MSTTVIECDKSKWPPGPWHTEPDRVEFEHLGFPCLITRVPGMGHLCGYVAVPPKHPWHGVDWIDESGGPAVHGGVTYSAKRQGHVCHVPKPGDSDDVWWIGFDCAHAEDASPGGRSLTMLTYATYRDINYVRGEIESLAAQARAAA